jgi:MoCo/4Fe-4S cofactor protein with predicted Tat translocation signal
MKETQIWKGLPGFENQIEEQANTSEFGDVNTPELAGITESISTESTTGRRDFLKMLGFSLSAAALAT